MEGSLDRLQAIPSFSGVARLSTILWTLILDYEFWTLGFGFWTLGFLSVLILLIILRISVSGLSKSADS